MTWISLVCLLALSGTVFSRSVPIAVGGGYGGYGGAAVLPVATKVLPTVREVFQRPTVVSAGYGATEVVTPVVEPILTKPINNYGATVVTTPTVTKVLPTAGYGAGLSRVLLDQPATTVIESTPTFVSSAPVQPLTPADMLCRGQTPETVIPLDGGQRFVVCLDESKGVEQFCPKGLIYVEALRRCERRTGPFDACSSQPCLNGGACLNTEYSYHCQCAPSFDGKNCELDARICQTQNPCGLGPDSRCQSFRWGAALDYICVFNDGDGYGLNTAQIHQSPCLGIDGPHALAFTNRGFIMCDGERTFYESCPGGTVWEDFNKACVWPDMQFEVTGYGHRSLVAKTGYGAPLVVEQKPLIATKVIESRPIVSGYGSEVVVPSRVVEPVVRPLAPAYGGETIVTKTLEPLRPVVSGYGGETLITKTLEPLRPVVSGYGGETLITKTLEPLRPVVSGYGGESIVTKTIEPFRPVVSGYGATAVVPRVHIEQPKIISSYGGAREEVLVKGPY